MKDYKETEYEAEYIEMLNETFDPYRIGSLYWEPACILREMDPIAYRMGLIEYVDMLERE